MMCAEVQAVVDAAVAYALAEKKVYEFSDPGRMSSMQQVANMQNVYGRDWITMFADKISDEQITARRATASAELLIAKSKLCSAVREFQKPTQGKV
jgi:hypothetical protein